MSRNVRVLLLIFLLFSYKSGYCQKSLREGRILINSHEGHSLQQGASGFNVRIADKVWSYEHPEFITAVRELKPGWLRYFSGTMGDAFNCATGLYDKDYAMMFDRPASYFKGYEFTQVKGPHRLVDLYELLGEVGGKLVVTINGFTETPEVAGQLARFCKNNNIIVEAWQFCNEPYFYVPGRGRYWWNDGYDYAVKMKPYANAIREVFPDAKLALNCSWDGISGFMKDIYRYQQENGAYWNVFSKHSYAPHIGGFESFDEACKRANTKLVEVTSSAAMDKIEAYSWEGIPVLITEFGVWNRPLNGIYSAIYNAEYTMRQLANPNLFLIGSHEISNKYRPANNFKKEIEAAYDSGKKINTTNLLGGIVKDDEGKALSLIHEATNNSVYTWDTQIEGGVLVDGMGNSSVEGVYARAFKGVNGFDYLVVTNRSGETCHFEVLMDNEPLELSVSRQYMSSLTAQNKNIPIVTDEVSLQPLQIPSYSVVLVKWQSKNSVAPGMSRIFKSVITENGVELEWWKKEKASGYQILYGMSPDSLNQRVEIEGAEHNSTTISELELDKDYWFGVKAQNDYGESEISPFAHIKYSKPDRPAIFKTATRDTTITVMWSSVPGASGYFVDVRQAADTMRFDAQNVFGFRIEGLEYDKPYSVSVSPYNGMGVGDASDEVVITCKQNLPLPPRNISAKETAEGYVYLHWVAQDSIHPSVKYRLYRSVDLCDFTPFTEGIVQLEYIVKDSALNYYYTVKAYNDDGECAFYPNIATVIRSDEQTKVEVAKIEKSVDGYVITVSFGNVTLNADARYGVSLSDVSFLTTDDESVFEGENARDGHFVVKIPSEALQKGRIYTVKGFLNLKGIFTYSLPPHKIIDLKNE
jgi:hypothetical protein